MAVEPTTGNRCPPAPEACHASLACPTPLPGWAAALRQPAARGFMVTTTIAGQNSSVALLLQVPPQ